MQRWLAAALCACLAWGAQAGDVPAALLERMAQAALSVEYDGVFIHQQGEQVRSLRTVHALRDGVVHERLSHLDGEPMEFIRRGDELRCLSADAGAARSLRRPATLGVQALNAAELAAVYALSLGEPVRVAGREAVQLLLRPRDEWRHGQRLAVDRASGLLLRAEQIDSSGRLLERVQFVNLRIGPVEEQALTATLPEKPLPPAPAPAAGAEVDWQPGWLPPGFRAAGGQRYSDGLASFSLFVEPVVTEAAEALVQQGATVLFSRTLPLADGVRQVTVVGDVPVLTARRLASEIRLREEAAHVH